MLYKVIIDQYRSFGSKEEISLIPNMKRTQFMNHVYQEHQAPVLNHCVLVGGNASGKSNWVNALAVVKTFCSNTRFEDAKADWLRRWYYDNRFFMYVNADDVPIHIMLDFSYKDTYYSYSVYFDGEGVKKECLYKTPQTKHRPVVIAMRTRDLMMFHSDYDVNNEVLETFHKLLIHYPSASFLAINAKERLVGLDFMDDVYEWFNAKLEVALQNYSFPMLTDHYCDTPKMLEFTNILLNKMGIGCHVVIKENDPNCWIQRNGARAGDLQRLFDGGMDATYLQSNENSLTSIRTIGTQKVVRELAFISHSANGTICTLNAQDLSTGTLRLLTILILLYKAIFTDSTVVIDDFDAHLNVATFKDLCKTYLETPTKGQLIYTANSIVTMNQQEMTRVDEIHMLEKQDGKSKVINLDRFSKFKIKLMLSLERNYMEGRFGGRPGKVEAADISTLS